MEVFDDFFDDPTAVRALAARQSFSAIGNYAGVGCFIDRCDFQSLMEQVAARMESPIRWNEAKAAFRLALTGEKPKFFVHHDDYRAVEGERAVHWTVVVSLTLNECMPTRDMGMTFLYDPVAKRSSAYLNCDSNMILPQDQRYIEMARIPYAYNRGLIFRSNMLHAQYGPTGFGTSVEDGRLIFTAWFYT